MTPERYVKWTIDHLPPPPPPHPPPLIHDKCCLLSHLLYMHFGSLYCKTIWTQIRLLHRVPCVFFHYKKRSGVRTKDIGRIRISHWYPGTGVVLDCIDSWSLPSFFKSINVSCLFSTFSVSSLTIRFSKNLSLQLVSWFIIKLFPCSAQLSIIFILLINVKMRTIVGILTFISMIET